jgi:hypothetical protein
LRQEKQKQAENTGNAGEAGPSTEQNDIEKLEKEKGEVHLRAITLADFVKAKDEVSPSVSEDAFSIAEVLYPVSFFLI